MKPITVLEKTYQIQYGSPAPGIDEYVEACRLEWSKLLDSSPYEEAVQLFLERNPMLLPGAWTPGTKSGHPPLHCAAISQPILPGLKARKPDFMWISTHSQTWYPTLIEIERPSKQVFTTKGGQSADFTQARNQLAQWRTWFSSPENVQLFIMSYGIPGWMRSNRQMKLHMILIYGRREEFRNVPELSKQRASLLTGSDEELMSFDRLALDRELRDAITVRATNCGKYKTVCVPPLFRLGPNLADRLLEIDGVESALKVTPLISDARRTFLASRIPYWQGWARNGARGPINDGDWE